MIDFKADIIDTRDIMTRIEELESDHTDDEGEMTPVPDWSPEDYKEWRGLQEIIEGVGDQARHGVTLIRQRYFTEYTRESYADTWAAEWTKEDPHTFKRSPVTWDDIVSRLPFSCIDWDRVADEVMPDYSTVDIDGITFYYRA